MTPSTMTVSAHCPAVNALAERAVVARHIFLDSKHAIMFWSENILRLVFPLFRIRVQTRSPKSNNSIHIVTAQPMTEPTALGGSTVMVP